MTQDTLWCFVLYTSCICVTLEPEGKEHDEDLPQIVWRVTLPESMSEDVTPASDSVWGVTLPESMSEDVTPASDSVGGVTLPESVSEDEHLPQLVRRELLYLNL